MMPRRRIAEVFGAVDPNLKVISGGVRRRKKQSEVNWDLAGGLRCKKCGAEVVRLINGYCVDCDTLREAERVERAGEAAERRYWAEQLRKGTVSLAQMKEGRLGS